MCEAKEEEREELVQSALKIFRRQPPATARRELIAMVKEVPEMVPILQKHGLITIEGTLIKIEARSDLDMQPFRDNTIQNFRDGVPTVSVRWPRGK